MIVLIRFSIFFTGPAIAIDGVAVGNGVWVGRLRCGQHRVEIEKHYDGDPL